MEGDAEQTALAAAQNNRPDVEKRRCPQAEGVVDQDCSDLLCDEEPCVAGVRQRYRLIEARGDRQKRDVLRRRGCHQQKEDERKDTRHARSQMQSIRLAGTAGGVGYPRLGRRLRFDVSTAPAHCALMKNYPQHLTASASILPAIIRNSIR